MEDVAASLLAWYDRHRRDLPWRYKPGEIADPYRVWLSEIMLQQTTVAAVTPYYRRFLAAYPNVTSLARAELDEILSLWAGLGYYARARNLHRCAQTIVQDHGGVFPTRAEDLMKLPGIGAYTAGAIAAIAFDEKIAAVDGNAERVVARHFAVKAPLPQAKPELRRLAQTLMPGRRAGDFVQAMMDLGSLICTPRDPGCPLCPWQHDCKAHRLGCAQSLPRRSEKPPRPIRFGTAFVLQDRNGAVLMRRRPPRGLLGGMMEVPSTPWTVQRPKNPLRSAPARADWVRIGEIEHVFTHFQLILDVRHAILGNDADTDGLWIGADLVRRKAVPSVMMKVLAAAGIGAISESPQSGSKPSPP
jgi:A/G-specific adenine glycosylase